MWSSRNQMLMENEGDDVAFLSGSGDSRHGLYNNGGNTGNAKRDYYDRGYVAQCTKAQAIGLTVFVFTAIFLTSLAIAFIRPFHAVCPGEEVHEEVWSIPEEEPEPTATNGETFPWDDIRLPAFIKPIRYDIELTPNLTSQWVKGIEKLIFSVTEETNFIVFHSKNITITSRTISNMLNVERMLEYPYREQVYLETDDYMVPGKTYAVRLKFQYKLSNHLEGFYLSRYRDKANVERLLATSHFEPTYARQAFPCFDEPALKAKFLMTITHEEDQVAFFNTPKKAVSAVRGGDDEPPQVRDEFEETVDMSTYLVAFVVCDFVSISEMSKKKVNVSVIASRDKIDQATFALGSATKIMDYYDEFFGVPYPLPKQDLIAIPDFGAGAMENWGLITYRETSLLFSEKDTSADAKQWVAVVVAHELAHQWFGNLVTMKWWNDIWLNEGFASWMEYRGVDHIQPDWRMMDQFFLDMIAPALTLDSLTTSHPISVDVKDPKEIEAIFDAISYKKGAAIIHMLEETVGEATLRRALSDYLNKHKFGNADTNDLWNAISDEWAKNPDRRFNLTVKEMMDTWTLQMGYPIITFEQQNDTNIYTIRQERFIRAEYLNDTDIDRRIEEDEEEDPGIFEWVVPLSYQTNVKDFPQHFVILNKSQTIDTEFPGDMEWFKANLNGTGYYRVNYPEENWDALILALVKDHRTFTAADRAQLLNDAFSLSQAGLLPATKPLEMCMYLLKEDEVVPWAVAIRHLDAWKVTLQETNIVPLLNSLLRHLISPVYLKIGWEDKGSHMDKLLRKLILVTAVNSDMEEAKKKATAMFTALKEKGQEVAPNLRWMVYSAGVKFGGMPEWKYAWDKYNRSQVPSEKSLWLKSLADSPHPYILQRYLDATLDRDKVKPQDAAAVMGGVAKNPAGSQLAFRHVRIHWDLLLEKFGAGSFVMGTIIESTTSHFSTEFDYGQVKAFFRNRPVGSGRRALDQSMEQIRINVQWRKDHEEDIRRWMLGKIGGEEDDI